jgi:(p)ppGpp synthase/HD superfamily hydrolase
MTGYSDRINHALAFAAKHHDQQVRRGARAPYSTQPANLAVILTRYGCDEDTVTAGILLEVVEDYSRDRFSQDVFVHRIADKFGTRALEIAQSVAERRTDDEGLDLSPEERRSDLLDRLAAALPESRFLAAADALHNAGTLLADLRRTMDAPSTWARVPGGKTRALESFQLLHERLAGAGTPGTILDELRQTISALAGIPD